MLTVEAQDASLPALGFGTFQLEGATCRTMVSKALEIGYRHVDTARIYGNEREVGQGLADSGLPRDSVWVTTKIWPEEFRDGALQRSTEQALQALALDHVDLLLLHWPSKEVPLAETMPALADAKSRGLARHVGLSNFTVDLVRQAIELCPEPLVTNQVEYHPFLDQGPVAAELRRQGMALTAYSPLGQGKVVEESCNEELVAIGKAHGKGPAQVALRWLLQQGCVAIPRSSSPEHARSNFDVFDFDLSDAELQRISALGSRDGRVIDPEGLAPDWD